MQNKVLKLRAFVTSADVSVIEGQSKICNWLYNYLLNDANVQKEHYKKTQNKEALYIYTKRGLRNRLPKLKEEKPFLKSVHSSPLKNTALRLSLSIQSYQKGKRKERKDSPNWPNFQSWKKNWSSLFLSQKRALR